MPKSIPQPESAPAVAVRPSSLPADTRLIKRWLPIAEIGIESLRERTPMKLFSAPNRFLVFDEL